MKGVKTMLSWSNLAKHNKEMKKILREEPPSWERWMTIKEAQEALGCSRYTIQQRIKEGRINAWKDPVSGRVSLLCEDVETEQKKRAVRESRVVSREIRDAEEKDSGAEEAWSWEIEIARQDEAKVKAEADSRAGFEAKAREIEAWYAAELAKIEEGEKGGREVGRKGGREEKADTDTEEVLETEETWESADAKDSEEDQNAQETEMDWEDSEVLEPEIFEDDNLVTAGEVGGLLGVTPEHVNAMRHEGKLTWSVPGRPGKAGLYSLRAVLALASQREKAFEARSAYRSEENRKSRERRDFIARWAQLPMDPDDQLVSTQEAATLMGVSPRRICVLITQGRLWGYQRLPGVMGSPIYLRLSHVTAYVNRKDHVRRREAYEKSRIAPSGIAKGWEEMGIPDVDRRESSAHTVRDYGDYYTARQAGKVLGIGIQGVRSLRERGRLVGYLKAPGKRVKEPAREARGSAWWFYRKEEVDALSLDASYCKHQNAYKRGVANSVPSGEDLERQLDACHAVARENARRRARQGVEW